MEQLAPYNRVEQSVAYWSNWTSLAGPRGIRHAENTTVSYIVSIRRVKQNGESAPSIPQAEFLKVVASDPQFRIQEMPNGNHDVVIALWTSTDTSTEVPFVYSREAGEIYVTSPSNAVLGKMQELAAKLGADIVGEEGEILTDAKVPSWEPAKERTGFCLGWGCLILLLVPVHIVHAVFRCLRFIYRAAIRAVRK